MSTGTDTAGPEEPAAAADERPAVDLGGLMDAVAQLDDRGVAPLAAAVEELDRAYAKVTELAENVRNQLTVTKAAVSAAERGSPIALGVPCHPCGLALLADAVVELDHACARIANRAQNLQEFLAVAKAAAVALGAPFLPDSRCQRCGSGDVRPRVRTDDAPASFTDPATTNDCTGEAHT